MYYCEHCGVLQEDETETKCVLEAVFYPNDDAHPAEYDDPTCLKCGNYVMDYACDECLILGSEDEVILIDEKNGMICHKCHIKKVVSEARLELHESVVASLVLSFGFIEGSNVDEYAEELIEELLNKKKEKDGIQLKSIAMSL